MRTIWLTRVRWWFLGFFSCIGVLMLYGVYHKWEVEAAREEYRQTYKPPQRVFITDHRNNIFARKFPLDSLMNNGWRFREFWAHTDTGRLRVDTVRLWFEKEER